MHGLALLLGQRSRDFDSPIKKVSPAGKEPTGRGLPVFAAIIMGNNTNANQ